MQAGKETDGVRERLERSRTLKVLELDLPVLARVGISAVLMGLLVLGVDTFSLPNPNMVLIAGLVICSSLFGMPGGLVSGAFMMGYTLYFFSVDHSLTTFTPENSMKVLVAAVGISVVGVFVCALKATMDRSLREAITLTELLREDNELLQEASTVDALTGLRNRFALRRDYPQYGDQRRPLHVLMLDLDNFKGINDEHGHERGDTMLAGVGGVLLDVFGPRWSYRYGGDEFLVIVPNWTDGTFERACESVREKMRELSVAEGEPANFSGGYVSGTPTYPSDLRLMIRQADDILYHAKRAGKDQIFGAAYDRGVAERLEVDGRSVRFGDRR